jgi:hypothetical protein
VVDRSHLHPAFAPLLDAYTKALDAAGIKYTVDSAYRSVPHQKEIWERSKHGTLFPAAPPGRSFHNFGMAADVIPANPRDYARMHEIAQSVGLAPANAKAGWSWDQPHVEMPGTLDANIAKYNLANFAPPESGYAVAANMPSVAAQPASATAPVGTTITSTPAQPVSATAPASLSSNPFLQALEAAESGTWGRPGSGRNIYSGVDKDVAGLNSRSQGYYQITTPTWETYAAKAGVDLKQYPNAMSAPKEIQARVAMEIPFNQFGGRTRQLLSGQFGAFDTKATVGQIAGGFGTPTQPGPGDASIRARGGTDVPVDGTAPAVAAAPSTNMGPAPGGAAPPEFAKTPLGKSLDELAKAMTPDQQQKPPPFLNLPSGARNVSPYLGGQGMLGQPPIAAAAQMQQSLGYQPTPVYGTGLTSLPASWSGATPGSPTQNQPQFGGFGPQTSPYGTSIGALDPMVAQMSRALALQQAAQPQQADPYGGYG